MGRGSGQAVIWLVMPHMLDYMASALYAAYGENSWGWDEGSLLSSSAFSQVMPHMLDDNHLGVRLGRFSLELRMSDIGEG